jgi:hypothetical protein
MPKQDRVNDRAKETLREERINVRTTKRLKNKALKIAKERGINLTQLINDYIKKLPAPKSDQLNRQQKQQLESELELPTSEEE